MRRADWLGALGLSTACAAALPLWLDPGLAAAALALLSLCG
ncbi:hypothetical protein PGB34_06100 [Xenophilus arseniciresistens]|uniref:Uncharacterized protein n=1 Tax=Xenophilus arseniciresistens TaxID=1283306 RepID=A0AAE3N8T7_9BURK|nr:hypothetical protein [Xenophilus arseniciresistens]MDA7415932.1 hypothetical protein [Xenophilus arseniciresistens]